MKRILAFVFLTFLVGCQTVAIEKPSFEARFPNSQWSKSGVSGGVEYRCKTKSCGGASTLLTYHRFIGNPKSSIVPLGDAPTIEESFRRSSGVRGGIIHLLLKHLDIRGEDLTAKNFRYYAKANYVGYAISGYSKVEGLHFAGEIRFDNNTVYIMGTEADTASRANSLYRQFLNVIEIQ